GRGPGCHGPSRCRGICAAVGPAPMRPRDMTTGHRDAQYSAPRCPVKRDSRGGDGPASRRDLLLRRGGELLGRDVELHAHLAGTEHLDGLVPAHRALGDEVLDRDGAALGEQLVQRDLPALEAGGHLVPRLGALGAATGRLALGGLTTADAGARGLGTGRGAQVVELHDGRLSALGLVGLTHVQSTSSNVTRWVTVRIMPRISGRSSFTTVSPMRLRPRPRRVARWVWLPPISDRVWVTLICIRHPPSPRGPRRDPRPVPAGAAPGRRPRPRGHDVPPRPPAPRAA